MKQVILVFIFSWSSLGFFGEPPEVDYYEDVTFDYDLEKERVVCLGRPIYDLRRVRDYREWKDKQREIGELPFSVCESLTRTRYYWTNSGRDFYNSGSKRSCRKHVNVKGHWVAIEEVSERNCLRATDAPESSSEALHITAADEELDSLCTDIEKCTLVLSETNRDILSEIGGIIGAIDRQNTISGLYEKLESEGNYSVRNEISSVLRVYRRTLRLCQSNLPDAHESLADDLRLDARTLERDISVFHWFKGDKALMGDSGYFRPENFRSLIYARVMQGLFWDATDDGGDYVGQGLYAAPDPNATSNYGEKLLRIDIEEGTTYLDIRGNNRSFQISEKTRELLKAEGCDYTPNDQLENGNYLYHKRSLYENRACRRIFNRVIEEEGYGFLAYDYESALPEFCDRNSSIDSAFVLFNIPLTSETVDLHTDTSPGNTENLSEEELRKLHEMAVIRQPATTLPGDGLSEQERQQVQDEWRDRLFRCDSTRGD